MECKHKFIGHSTGVTCKYCKMTMTQDEYVKMNKVDPFSQYMNPPEEPTEADIEAEKERKKAERVAKLQAGAKKARERKLAEKAGK